MKVCFSFVIKALTYEESLNKIRRSKLGHPHTLSQTNTAYGIFFWQLGFYWDDLPISWIRYQLGTEATTKYFSDSRPVWAWLYQLSAYLLPQKPAYWQLFAMFWRWVGVVTFWLVLARLFPHVAKICVFAFIVRAYLSRLQPAVGQLCVFAFFHCSIFPLDLMVFDASRKDHPRNDLFGFAPFDVRVFLPA
jgi:hypothetical protein